MYKLLKVKLSDIGGGNIYHLKKNGSLARRLSLEDAEIICEKPFTNEPYAFFILECENSDYVKYGKDKKIKLGVPECVDIDGSDTRKHAKWCSYYCCMSDLIFIEALCITQYYHDMCRVRKVPDYRFEKLLSSQLKRYFSLVMKRCLRNRPDSKDVWRYYSDMLINMKKTANDLVCSDIIDNFFLEMCTSHDVEQITEILNSNVITVSHEVSLKIERTKKELEETKKIAKDTVFEFFKDLEEKYITVKDLVPRTKFYIKDTPCGDMYVIIGSRPILFRIEIFIFNFTLHPKYHMSMDITTDCPELVEYSKKLFKP